ncbi:MAG: hypothetical protein ACNYPE_15430 [Candidatus Azotimanducaceae bacterium WSBS_2022_MAG_OTU7]
MVAAWTAGVRVRKTTGKGTVAVYWRESRAIKERLTNSEKVDIDFDRDGVTFGEPR